MSLPGGGWGPFLLPLYSAQSYIDKTLAGWPYKMALSPAVIIYGNFFGGDGYILAGFYGLFLLDLLAGVAVAVKRQIFSLKKFDMWAVKLIVYTLSILVIGVINGAIARSWNFNPPLLDTVVTLLIASEAVSFLNNLQELTGRVPPIILRLLEKIQAKADKNLETMIDDLREGNK